MAIALEDRIRRALAVAGARGTVHATQRVVDALGTLPSPTVALDAAAAAVVLVSAVDATGRARGDSLPRAMHVVAVLEDEGRLLPQVAGAQVTGVDAVVCRRGLVECGPHGFMLVEVEDGVSARETQAEYAVPMLADERLVAFR